MNWLGIDSVFQGTWFRPPVPSFSYFSCRPGTKSTGGLKIDLC